MNLSQFVDSTSVDFTSVLTQYAQETKKRIELPLNKRGEVTIYFAHALTGVEKAKLENLEIIKKEVQAIFKPVPVVPTNFYGLAKASSSEQIVSYDLEQALSVDLMVALHVQPSYGTGAEIHLRSFLGLPILFLYPSTAHISRMVTGITKYGDHCKIAEYSSTEEAVEIIKISLFEE